MHTYVNLSEMSVDDMRFHVDKYNKSHRKNPVKFTVRKIADDKYFAAVDGSAEAEFDKVPVAKNVPPDFKMLDSGKYRVIGRSFRDLIDNCRRNTFDGDKTSFDAKAILAKISDPSFHDGLCACCGTKRNRNELYYVVKQGVTNPTKDDVYTVGSSCVNNVALCSSYFDLLKALDRSASDPLSLTKGISHRGISTKGNSNNIKPNEYLACALTASTLGLTSLGSPNRKLSSRLPYNDVVTPDTSYRKIDAFNNNIDTLDAWSYRLYLAFHKSAYDEATLSAPDYIYSLLNDSRLCDGDVDDIYNENLKAVNEILSDDRFVSVFRRYSDIIGVHNAGIVKDTNSYYYSKNAGPTFLTSLNEYLQNQAELDLPKGLSTKHLIPDVSSQFTELAKTENYNPRVLLFKHNDDCFAFSKLADLSGTTIKALQDRLTIEDVHDIYATGFYHLPERKYTDSNINDVVLPEAVVAVPFFKFNDKDNFNRVHYDKQGNEYDMNHGSYRDDVGYTIVRQPDRTASMVFFNNHDGEKKYVAMDTAIVASLFGKSPSKDDLMAFCRNEKTFCLYGKNAQVSFDSLCRDYDNVMDALQSHISMLNARNYVDTPEQPVTKSNKPTVQPRSKSDTTGCTLSGFFMRDPASQYNLSFVCPIKLNDDVYYLNTVASQPYSDTDSVSKVVSDRTGAIHIDWKVPGTFKAQSFAGLPHTDLSMADIKKGNDAYFSMKDGDKSYYRWARFVNHNKKECVYCHFMNEPVYFKASYAQHRFTSDEINTLVTGAPVSVTFCDRNNKVRTKKLQLCIATGEKAREIRKSKAHGEVSPVCFVGDARFIKDGRWIDTPSSPFYGSNNNYQSRRYSSNSGTSGKRRLPNVNVNNSSANKGCFNYDNNDDRYG